MAHFAHWQEYRATRLAALARHEEPPPSVANYEQANADCFERYCGRPWAEVQAYADQALSQPDGSTVAFVFGREDRGLHTRELDLCHAFVTIPTADDYPSMNLSHAVALLLYELSKKRRVADTSANGNRMPAQAGDIENMFQHMRRTLLEAEYLDPQNPDHILRAFRRLFGRSGLDAREVRILQGLWSRMDWINRQRNKAVDKKR